MCCHVSLGFPGLGAATKPRVLRIVVAELPLASRDCSTARHGRRPTFAASSSVSPTMVRGRNGSAYDRIRSAGLGKAKRAQTPRNRVLGCVPETLTPQPQNAAIIQVCSDKPWNWNGISANPNITWEIIQNNPDKNWNWNCISWNRFGKS